MLTVLVVARRGQAAGLQGRGLGGAQDAPFLPPDRLEPGVPTGNRHNGGLIVARHTRLCRSIRRPSSLRAARSTPPTPSTSGLSTKRTPRVSEPARRPKASSEQWFIKQVYCANLVNEKYVSLSQQCPSKLEQCSRARKFTRHLRSKQELYATFHPGQASN